jgi:o-succinylbenzoate---CoA ligase
LSVECFFKKNDRLLLCLNPQFIGGKMMLVRAFVNNMNIFAVSPSSNPFQRLEKSDRFDFTALSPHQLYTMMIKAPDKTEVLEHMKAVIVGGAPIDPPLKEMIQHLKVPIYSTYGMTETVSHVALQRMNGPDHVDFFEGIGDTEFGADKRGCLTIIGTVTNRELLLTNDLVELLSPKAFKWIGRIDNVINSGGLKIQVEEVERKITKLLSENNLYNRFFIFPKSDEALGQKVCMAVESPGQSAHKLKEMLASALNSYETPKEIFFIEKFAETPTGKIDRKKSIGLPQDDDKTVGSLRRR